MHIDDLEDSCGEDRWKKILLMCHLEQKNKENYNKCQDLCTLGELFYEVVKRKVSLLKKDVHRHYKVFAQ